MGGAGGRAWPLGRRHAAEIRRGEWRLPVRWLDHHPVCLRRHGAGRDLGRLPLPPRLAGGRRQGRREWRLPRRAQRPHRPALRHGHADAGRGGPGLRGLRAMIRLALALLLLAAPASAHGGHAAAAEGSAFDPWVVVPLALTWVLYARGTTRLWRLGLGRGVPRWRVACFLAGWLTIILALLSPLRVA